MNKRQEPSWEHMDEMRKWEQHVTGKCNYLAEFVGVCKKEVVMPGHLKETEPKVCRERQVIGERYARSRHLKESCFIRGSVFFLKHSTGALLKPYFHSSFLLTKAAPGNPASFFAPLLTAASDSSRRNLCSDSVSALLTADQGWKTNFAHYSSWSWSQAMTVIRPLPIPDT